MIDPKTYFLQNVDPTSDQSGQLPFVLQKVHTPADLMNRVHQDKLAASVIDYQLSHGATMIIAPYVHIERADTVWTEVQIGLWQATRRCLDWQQLHVPVLAVGALGWRQLDRATWPGTLQVLMATLIHELHPGEVALAASTVDDGVRPAERLSSLIAVVHHLGQHWSVIMWQQGVLGEAAVAAGAAGYECGIGWRERCDLGTRMRAHDDTPVPGPRNARPVYITALKRSLLKRSIELLQQDPRIIAQLICLDPTCCPNGRRTLLEDARAHAIAARRRGLTVLTRPTHAAWRWNQLALDVTAGLQLAERINILAGQTQGLSRVNTRALVATLALANHRRQTLGRRAA